MKSLIIVSIAIVMVLSIALSVDVAVPKTMAVNLNYEQNCVFTSDVFHLPLRIYNASLDISVLTDTFLGVTLELRSGDNYVQFNLNDLSITGHLTYNIFDIFTTITSDYISLRLLVNTDGIIQGTPKVTIMYYGLY
jgi:hypothetical protein